MTQPEFYHSTHIIQSERQMMAKEKLELSSLGPYQSQCGW